MRVISRLRQALTQEPDQNSLFLGVVFLGTLIPLLYGFTRFPRFYGDEGVYVSQAWWLVYFRKLGPYTYWYDHFPLGWLLIGLWQKLTGGPFTLGFSVLSGRLLAILLTGISNVFLFKLLYRLTHKSLLISLFGSLLFALSPLMVIYHRLSLLDNLASFWLVLSLSVFFSLPRSGKRVFLGSLFLGLAVLTKETVGFLVPAFLVSVVRLNKDNNRGYFLVLSLVTLVFLIGWWPLLASLKGEFLPGAGHVSWLETLISQAQRGNQLPVWNWQSDFLTRSRLWLAVDPFLIIAGLGSGLLAFLFRPANRIVQSICLLTLSYLVFLVRGGTVFDFYVIPLLPLLVVQVSLLLFFLSQEVGWLKKNLFQFIGLGVLVVASIGLVWLGRMAYAVDATANQKEAIAYLKDNISDTQAVILVDDYAFLDLRLDQDYQSRFPHVEWYARAELDPKIKGQLDNSPQAVDYLLENKVMAEDIEYGDFSFIGQIRETLIPQRSFGFEAPGFSKAEKNLISNFTDELVLYGQEVGTNESSEETLKDEPLETLVRRLVLLAPAGTKLTNQEQGLLKNQSGMGAVLVERNIESREQVEELISELNDLGVVVAVDQEGGPVSRLEWVENTAQGQITTEVEALSVAQKRGEELNQLGIGINLAPVVSLVDDDQSYLGRSGRAFSKNNGALAAAMVKGYLQTKVMPVAKHFPGGLGRVMEDPHQTLPSLTVTQQQLEEDLAPFRTVIKAQVPMIMVTHILYPEIDNYPASSSQIFMDNILKNRLGFKGLVMVDDLSMGAVKDNYDVGKYAVQSLKAGADLLLVSDFSDYQKIIVALIQATEQGELSRERLIEAHIKLEEFF